LIGFWYVQQSLCEGSIFFMHHSIAFATRKGRRGGGGHPEFRPECKAERGKKNMRNNCSAVLIRIRIRYHWITGPYPDLDPYHWITDPYPDLASDSDPALFFSGFYYTYRSHIYINQSSKITSA
jgi:hypothetical protein